ncbi:MAG: translation initiation factor [Bacteroidales bacterium]|nr:translation initiation factor [Bacteroidales bacterium]
MGKSKKNRIDVVYSTNPDFEYDFEENEEQETIEPKLQDLRVGLDKKQRKGKVVTLVTGFIGTDSDLVELSKQLKSICGVGGSAKDQEIILQGDQREKVSNWLLNKGYKVKKIGG